MSRAKLKSAVARTMRDANIDFDEIDQRTIWKRHRARFTLVRHEFYSMVAKDKSVEPSLRVKYRTMLNDGEFKEEVKHARSLLKDDTPDRWADDQAAIEAYELRKYGHLDYVRRDWAFGAGADEMFEHWLELLREPERLERECEQRRLEERAQVEKERGKPIC